MALPRIRPAAFVRISRSPGVLVTTIRQARELAREWVTDEAHGTAGFHGAFLAGSAIWLPPEDTLVPASDVDITIVLDTDRPPDKIGKFRYRDIMLDVSYMSTAALRSADAILSDYHLAGTFARPGILADPTGTLTTLQRDVAAGFTREHWVRRRCEHARDKVLTGLAGISTTRPFHDNVLGWLFPIGVTTHILLVAGLRSPTIRTRYLAVRQLLHDYDRSDAYEPLLALLGCAEMTGPRAARHLAAVTGMFDAARALGNTSFPFSSDISEAGRPVAIDGSRDLIARGDHREAVFWLVATASRCQAILDLEAPDVRYRFDDAYRQLLADLGVASLRDLQLRAEAVRNALPGIMEVADAIITANPAIWHT